jgi:hypothetical protein
MDLFNINLVYSLFCFYFSTIIGIAGLDHSIGTILTPFCLFISGCLFMIEIHFLKLYPKDKKGD